MNRDILRAAIRAATPKRVYTAAHHLLNASTAARKLGLTKYRQLMATETSTKSGLSSFEFPNLQFPIAVRNGSTDASLVIETLTREMYAFRSPQGGVKTIVDAGANIGDTTAWYLSRYREATVAALEPSVENYRMLEQNCAPYGARAIPLHAALWTKSGELHFADGQRSLGGRAAAASGGASSNVAAFSMQDVMRRMGAADLDIFKCDIEGAELPLFTDPGVSEWLPHVKSIFIELHGPQARQVIPEVVGSFGFAVERFREMYVFRRARP